MRWWRSARWIFVEERAEERPEGVFPLLLAGYEWAALDFTVYDIAIYDKLVAGP